MSTDKANVQQIMDAIEDVLAQHNVGQARVVLQLYDGAAATNDAVAGMTQPHEAQAQPSLPSPSSSRATDATPLPVRRPCGEAQHEVIVERHSNADVALRHVDSGDGGGGDGGVRAMEAKGHSTCAPQRVMHLPVVVGAAAPPEQHPPPSPRKQTPPPRPVSQSERRTHTSRPHDTDNDDVSSNSSSGSGSGGGPRVSARLTVVPQSVTSTHAANAATAARPASPRLPPQPRHSAGSADDTQARHATTAAANAVHDVDDGDGRVDDSSEVSPTAAVDRLDCTARPTDAVRNSSSSNGDAAATRPRNGDDDDATTSSVPPQANADDGSPAAATATAAAVADVVPVLALPPDLQEQIALQSDRQRRIDILNSFVGKSALLESKRQREQAAAAAAAATQRRHLINPFMAPLVGALAQTTPTAAATNNNNSSSSTTTTTTMTSSTASGNNSSSSSASAPTTTTTSNTRHNMVRLPAETLPRLPSRRQTPPVAGTVPVFSILSNGSGGGSEPRSGAGNETVTIRDVAKDTHTTTTPTMTRPANAAAAGAAADATARRVPPDSILVNSHNHTSRPTSLPPAVAAPPEGGGGAAHTATTTTPAATGDVAATATSPGGTSRLPAVTPQRASDAATALRRPASSNNNGGGGGAVVSSSLSPLSAVGKSTGKVLSLKEMLSEQQRMEQQSREQLAQHAAIMARARRSIAEMEARRGSNSSSSNNSGNDSNNNNVVVGSHSGNGDMSDGNTAPLDVAALLHNPVRSRPASSPRSPPRPLSRGVAQTTTTTTTPSSSSAAAVGGVEGGVLKPSIQVLNITLPSDERARSEAIEQLSRSPAGLQCLSSKEKFAAMLQAQQQELSKHTDHEAEYKRTLEAAIEYNKMLGYRPS